MGRPKGSKNKEVGTTTEDTAVTQTINVEKVEVNDEIKKEVEQIGQKKEVLKKEAPKLEPLQPGQTYFEAPDGTVIIGEDTKNEIWYRAGNNGKGMWINKKR